MSNVLTKEDAEEDIDAYVDALFVRIDALPSSTKTPTGPVS